MYRSLVIIIHWFTGKNIRCLIFIEWQDGLPKAVNNTTNMNAKKLQFIGLHIVNGDGSKTAKIIRPKR